MGLVCRMRENSIPINHAGIMFYIYDHKDAEQKNMKLKLNMSSNLICAAVCILEAQGYVIKQKIEGAGYNKKHHNLTKQGRDIVNKLLCEST